MITAKVTGDKEAVALFEEKIPQLYYDGILAAVTETTAEIKALAQGLAPSKTGQLRASIQSSVRKGGDFIKGRVYSTDGAKAVALEYGADGRSKTQVRPHTQTLTHAFAESIAPIRVSVPAYTRIQNIKAHPFMRPALAEEAGTFNDRLQAAIDGATDAANAELAK